jgi:large subunit ribosomal protein L10
LPTPAKEARVNDLREKLSRAKGTYLTSFSGLTVEEITNLRVALRKEKVEYEVVKNTLLKKAAANTPVSKLDPMLEGPNGIAITFDDAIVPARVLTKFTKTQPKLTLKAAVVDGGLVEAKDLQALADLPSREVLLSQLLSLLNSVPQQLVNVLAAVPRSLVNVLDAVRADKDKAEQA